MLFVFFTNFTYKLGEEVVEYGRKKLHQRVRLLKIDKYRSRYTLLEPKTKKCIVDFEELPESKNSMKSCSCALLSTSGAFSKVWFRTFLFSDRR